jgi:hypothetical protein
MAIEEQILKIDSPNLAGGDPESLIRQIAGELDNTGYNVSRHGGNLILLRMAMRDAQKVGRPFLKDFNTAVEAFALEDLAAPYAAVDRLIGNISETWQAMLKSERRAVVIDVVEQRKLDLLIAKAKQLPDDQGIRLLLAEKVDGPVIVTAMGITDEKLQQVKDQIKKELAERERVAGLLAAVADKSDVEKVKHLFTNDVAEALILEMAGVDQGAIDGARQAMEAEQKEKQRLAEEEAARKKKEAEGPSLEDISAEDMANYIYSIREIMEFSDQEKDIRTMCEQSSIPKALVDIAVSDPAKLDELEKQAQG